MDYHDPGDGPKTKRRPSWFSSWSASLVHAWTHPRTADKWDPETYPSFIAGFENYEALQAAVVELTRSTGASRILELGVGTGEVARELLSVHEGATLVGIDASQPMLDAAAVALPPGRAKLVRGRLEEVALPGRFDLVVSVLTVHHVDAPHKAALFGRISDALVPGGHFVLGDILPETLERKPAVTGLRHSFRDRGVQGTARRTLVRFNENLRALLRREPEPDLLSDHVTWLNESGLEVEVPWRRHPLAVIDAQKPGE